MSSALSPFMIHRKKGDVINIPPHVERWHGALVNSRLIHIVITNFDGDEFVTWLRPVTSEEYTKVNQSIKMKKYCLWLVVVIAFFSNRSCTSQILQK